MPLLESDLSENHYLYVLSALLLGLYEEAEILCNCLKFSNENIFAFLYGLCVTGLKKAALAKTVLTSPEFQNGFRFLTGKYTENLYFENWATNIELNFFESETSLNQISAKLYHDNIDFSTLCSSILKGCQVSFSDIYKTIESFKCFKNQIKRFGPDILKNREVRFNQFIGSVHFDQEIGRQFLFISEYSKAKDHFERSFSINRFTCESFGFYSTVLWHLNEKELLFALAFRCKAYFNDQSEALIAVGNFFSYIGCNEQAIQYFKRAFMQDKSAFYSLFLEGHDWLSLNNHDEAERCFEELRKAESENFMGYFGLGITSYKKKNYEIALKYIKIADSLSPNNPNILWYFSMILESFGAKNEALEVIEASDKHSASIVAYRKSKLAAELELHEKAVNYLKEAIDNSPNDPALFYKLSEIQHKHGNLSFSVKFLKKANELEPSNPLAKEFLNTIGL